MFSSFGLRGVASATACGSAAGIQAFGKMGADFPGEIGFDRARVSLLVGDAELAQRLDNGAGRHLEFAREFIYADRTHSIAGLYHPLSLSSRHHWQRRPRRPWNSANRFCFSVFYGSRFVL